MTLASRIVTALEAKGLKWPGGPANAEIRRTHAGRHQRACGAWSWFLWPKEGDAGFPSVGSSEPAGKIAKGFAVFWNRQTRSYELQSNPTGKLVDELEGGE
jgi:hypothetical protein